MATVIIDGRLTAYEDKGRGFPIVLTSGARAPMKSMEPLASQLAEDFRVILWDRFGVGASDAVFEGPADLELWAGQLAQLLHHLGTGPAHLAGAATGVRLSLRCALRFPELVRGLFLWQITAGPIAERLGAMYYGQYAPIAEEQGMEGVVQLPYFAGAVQANPRNRARLLAADPKVFATTCRRWAAAFRPEDPAVGVTAKELGDIQAPVRVLAVCDAMAHPKERSQLVAKLLPRGECLDAPEASLEWERLQKGGPPLAPPYGRLSQIYPALKDFITTTEAESARKASPWGAGTRSGGPN